LFFPPHFLLTYANFIFFQQTVYGRFLEETGLDISSLVATPQAKLPDQLTNGLMLDLFACGIGVRHQSQEGAAEWLIQLAGLTVTPPALRTHLLRLKKRLQDLRRKPKEQEVLQNEAFKFKSTTTDPSPMAPPNPTPVSFIHELPQASRFPVQYEATAIPSSSPQPSVSCPTSSSSASTATFHASVIHDTKLALRGLNFQMSRTQKTEKS